MRAFFTTFGVAAVALLMSAWTAAADSPASGDATASVDTSGVPADYPVLTRGRVMLVNAQRLVVTREPRPLAAIDEAPPEPRVAEHRPKPPSARAIWVAGHWIYGPTGFSWIAGRYIAARAGHVFVPPRWAVYEDQYLYFNGFYVPHNVYVRSHFNRYYYSGVPKGGSRPAHGPYWPVGAPTRANSSLTSANARDPYWPIGVRR